MHGDMFSPQEGKGDGVLSGLLVTALAWHVRDQGLIPHLGSNLLTHSDNRITYKGVYEQK